MAKLQRQGNELEELFRLARRDLPNHAEQQRVMAAVHASIGSGVPVSAELLALQMNKRLLVGKTLGKIGAGLGVAAFLTLGAVALRERAPEAPRQAVEATAPTASAIEAASPVAIEVPPKSLPEATAKVTSPKTLSRESPKELPSEATLIDQAHRLLQAEPAQALAVTERHRKLYPQGILAQEREVIAIEALARLGKARDAEQRVNDFRAKQPHSVHELRLRNVTHDAGLGATR